MADSLIPGTSPTIDWNAAYWASSPGATISGPTRTRQDLYNKLKVDENATGQAYIDYIGGGGTPYPYIDFSKEQRLLKEQERGAEARALDPTTVLYDGALGIRSDYFYKVDPNDPYNRIGYDRATTNRPGTHNGVQYTYAETPPLPEGETWYRDAEGNMTSEDKFGYGAEYRAYQEAGGTENMSDYINNIRPYIKAQEARALDPTVPLWDGQLSQQSNKFYKEDPNSSNDYIGYDRATTPWDTTFDGQEYMRDETPPLTEGETWYTDATGTNNVSLLPDEVLDFRIEQGFVPTTAATTTTTPSGVVDSAGTPTLNDPTITITSAAGLLAPGEVPPGYAPINAFNIPEYTQDVNNYVYGVGLSDLTGMGYDQWGSDLSNPYYLPTDITQGSGVSNTLDVVLPKEITQQQIVDSGGSDSTVNVITHNSETNPDNLPMTTNSDGVPAIGEAGVSDEGIAISVSTNGEVNMPSNVTYVTIDGVGVLNPNHPDNDPSLGDGSSGGSDTNSDGSSQGGTGIEGGGDMGPGVDVGDDDVGVASYW